MVPYLGKPDHPKGRKIAERLAEHSADPSALGLLFLIARKERRDDKIVLSRFPQQRDLRRRNTGYPLLQAVRNELDNAMISWPPCSFCPTVSPDTEPCRNVRTMLRSFLLE